MKYIVISNTDGDTLVECLPETELKKRLDEKYYGNVEFMTEENIDRHPDTNCWGDNKLLIIKGDVVIPKAIATVTRYEL